MLLSREAHEQRVDELTQLTLTLTLTLTRGAHEQRVDERGARVKGVEQGRPQKRRRALAISREHRQPASAALVRILRQQRLRLRRCIGGAEAVQRRCRGGAEAVQEAAGTQGYRCAPRYGRARAGHSARGRRLARALQSSRRRSSWTRGCSRWQSRCSRAHQRTRQRSSRRRRRRGHLARSAVRGRATPRGSTLRASRSP